MSNADYNVIQRTTLSGFAQLPSDLQNRYLATCPRSVQVALLKLANQ
ncbi:hypothetical protein M3I01_013585 [Marinomonas sp. RSW2]|uniref:Uncharacterized protein n=1 Tax=Marinomonas maritima TaxID=2940935 RepID=A0ABT5WIQ4_9GAMM|nr:hypothetical protein [Marinomonas maritima]MDE8603930.1 hypothetical protein [Marinomonas maritima]